MLGLTIVTALGGFALGSYLTFRYAPTLAPGPGSVAIGLIVCALVGAATGLACMYVYVAIYEFVREPAVNSGLLAVSGGHEVSPDANIFVGAVFSIATESGVLLALAAGVFLLAPARRALASD